MKTLLVLALVLLDGCGRKSSDRDPKRTPPPVASADAAPDAPPPPPREAADPILEADDLRIEWERASGAVLIDHGSLRADGQLRWIRTAPGATRPGVLETNVSADEVRTVRTAVASAKFFALAPEFREPGVQDGSQLLRVHAGGRAHRVRCDNRCPAEIERVTSAIDALLTSARAAALASARAARPGDFNPELRAQSR